MKTFKKRTVMPVAAKELAAWHERPGAFQRLAPPWEKMTLVAEPESIADGAIAEIRTSFGPLGMRWIAEHRDCRPGVAFTDVQKRGPFAHWEHHHRFLEADGEGSALEDEVHYRLPGGWLGAVLGGHLIEKRLRQTFHYRHGVTAMDLGRMSAEPENVAGIETVLLSGATGMIGRALEGYLKQRGMKVIRLTRRPRRATDCFWDPDRDEMHLPTETRVDAVVHLAGENIAAGRWSEKRKRAILESRRRGTRLLCERLAALDERPRVLVSASGVNYYGLGTEDPQDETSPPGSGFLTDVCEAWEEETEEAAKCGIRTVRLRLGVVLSPAGGALAKMLPVFKLGLGGRLGSGNQRMPWVALDDVIDVMHRALVDERYEGPLNVVAPDLVDNRAFTRALAEVLGRPAFFGLPAFVLQKGLGQMARETLLADLHVVPSALRDLDYPFRFPDLAEALRFMLPSRGAA